MADKKKWNREEHTGVYQIPVLELGNGFTYFHHIVNDYIKQMKAMNKQRWQYVMNQRS